MNRSELDELDEFDALDGARAGSGRELRAASNADEERARAGGASVSIGGRAVAGARAT